MMDMFVKSNQRSAGCRLDDGGFHIVASKGMNCLPRIPQRNGEKLDTIRRLPPQQPGAAIALKSGQ